MSDLPLAFIICTEPRFEWKSRLLVRSLRAFGGNLADKPIISYSPRVDAKPSATCIAEFGGMKVETIGDDLNTAFPDYGLSNKIVAMADAERRLPGTSLVFLDSDKVILREPAALTALSGYQFAARPVDVAGIGARQFDEVPNGEYWKQLYGMCGVRRPLTVTTALDRRSILAYFNSGMVFAGAGSGLPGAWLDNFTRVWTSQLRPQAGEFFVEQSVLAATVAARCDRVRLLPADYNVPVHLIQAAGFRGERPAAATSIHYHDIFDGDDYPGRIMNMGGMVEPASLVWIGDNIRELR